MYISSCICPSDRKWMLRCYQRTLTTDDAKVGALNRYELASTHQIGHKWSLPCLEELLWPFRCVCLTMCVWDSAFVCLLDWTGLPALVRWPGWCFWSIFENCSWSFVYIAMRKQQNFVGLEYTIQPLDTTQVLQWTMSWVMYILIWPKHSEAFQGCGSCASWSWECVVYLKSWCVQQFYLWHHHISLQ